MAFLEVFRALKEVFPQVDDRILKAAAIEHSKDADMAVEFILCDVVPSISEPPESSCALDTQETMHSSHSEVGFSLLTFQPGNPESEEANTSQLSDLEVGASKSILSDCPITDHVTSCVEEIIVRDSHVDDSNGPSFMGNHGDAHVVVESSLHSEEIPVEYEVPLLPDQNIDGSHCKSNSLHETLAIGSESEANSGKSYNKLLSNVEIESFSSVEDMIQGHQSSDSIHDTDVQGSVDGYRIDAFPAVHNTIQDIQSSSTLNGMSSVLVSEAVGEEDGNGFASGNEKQLSTCSADSVDVDNFNTLEYKLTDTFISSSVQEGTSTLRGNDISFTECGDSVLKDFHYFPDGMDELLLKYTTEQVADMSSQTDRSCIDVNCQPISVTNGSSQFVSIDFLEDFVGEGTNNKKNLVCAMESVIDMMKDVEIHEVKAKEAKEEAAEAGEATLIKVEELRQMLKHAKEANDMHAGEVYGEKSILATEARELQSRLLRLSEEKDKSLGVIEEIHKTLEARLAAAKDEIEAAEQEKLEKERLAGEALSEQELIMDSVVQESKRLCQEAEENTKLREFLMERGQAVDILQGEIAVICEDIMSLKERVDRRIPLSGALSSRTGSLASSTSSSHGSSSTRVAPHLGLQHLDLAINQQKLESQDLDNSTNSDKMLPGKTTNLDSDEWEFCEVCDASLESPLQKSQEC